MRRSILLVILTLTYACLLQATEYHVSAGGDDGLTGLSKSQAWQSFGHAMSQMRPGDVMVIEDGTYYLPINVTVSGTPNRPITIRGRSRDNVIIIGTETAAGINISNQENVTVEDMTVNGGSQGAYIINSKHIILRRIFITRVSQVGIWFRDRNDDFLVTECNIEDMTGTGNNGWGMRVNDDNGGKRGRGRIERCVFKNGWRAGARLEDTIVDLYDNVFENWGGDGGRDHGVYYGNGAPVYDPGTTTIIEGNIFRKNLGYGLKISCWYEPANIVVRNNILAENRYGGLIITFGVDGVKAYNNTFYNNSGTNLQMNAYNYKSGKYNKNTKIKNNLFFSNEGELVLLMDDCLEELEMDYNCYWSTRGTKFRIRRNPSSYTSYSSLEAWKGNAIAPWVDEHSLFADPRMANPAQGDYTIGQDSPCFDAGTPLADVTYDFDKVTRPQGTAYDIGAYEYNLYSSVDDPGKAKPLHFSLDQNRPNPFNLETTIWYRIPERTPVRIEIRNCLGQRIRTLTDSRMEAGSHSVTWDGTNELGQAACSGIYFCEMRAGEFQAVRRMILIK